MIPFMPAWRRALTGFFCLVCALNAAAAGLAGISQADAGAGLKEALMRGAEFAVRQLGTRDGFLGNEAVRIPLPPTLQSAAQAMQMFGLGKQADQLVTGMNRAAELAVVEAQPILVDAIRQMSVRDAHAILTGGEGSATRFFREKTGEAIAARFLPIVQASTAKVGLTAQYNAFAGAAASTGLLDRKEADLDRYVAAQAVDGLFKMVAEQERAIRKDPVATGSSLLKKVFGAL